MTEASTAIVKTAAILTSKLFSNRSKIDHDQRQRMLQQHDELYAPLAVALCDCHVASVTFARYPSAVQRTRNAARKLTKGRWQDTWYWRTALHAIFDKGLSTAYDVEHGWFSLASVTRIVERVPHLADRQLLDHIASAHYSRYEIENESLTEAEAELISYIRKRHRQLAKVLFG